MILKGNKKNLLWGKEGRRTICEEPARGEGTTAHTPI